MRISALMDYSFEVCYMFGNVFLSNDEKACALVLYPDRKKTTFRSILLDAKLIISCVGVKNIRRTLDRETKIKQVQVKDKMYYLWFIGVNPEYQNTGIGTGLLKEVINDSQIQNRPIYLETSTLKNLPWYKSQGFKVYHELDLGYRLFFLNKELNKMQS